MRRILNVDVYIDLICPWCLIGKSHLRRALERLAETDPDVDVRVRWHSVQLAPDVAAEGWPFAEFYERRLGGREAAQARQAQVRAAAAQAGASIDFSRINIFPNTAKAHRLLAVGAPQLDANGFDRLIDRLFSAYFQRGENLGDGATLTAIAAEQGLDPDETRKALATNGNLLTSPAVQGVPYFVLNRRYAISGAQPAEMLHAAMRQTLATGAEQTATTG
jgi:predicted DsbA family dithiol-disulfide isomerase